MKSKIICVIFALFGIITTVSAEYSPVTVTLTIDEGVARPAALANAEKNLGIVLTEINRAQFFDKIAYSFVGCNPILL